MEQERTEEQELSRLFNKISDEEMKIVIAEYLQPFGYVQVDDKRAFLAFRNEELDLDIKVRYDKRHTYKILIKRGASEWVTVEDDIQKHNIAESIKGQGIIEFRQLMRESGSQLLLQLGLLRE